MMKNIDDRKLAPKDPNKATSSSIKDCTAFLAGSTRTRRSFEESELQLHLTNETARHHPILNHNFGLPLRSSSGLTFRFCPAAVEPAIAFCQDPKTD